VSFAQAPHLDLEVTLSGPHSAFNRLDRLLKKQPVTNRIEFTFDAALEEMDLPGNHRLVLLDFLQKDEQLRRLGLKVKSCDPNSVDVNVVALTKKQLPVGCVNESDQELTPQSITPAKVEMYAPEYCRAAFVQLSQREIQAARSEPHEDRPYILLAPGQRRMAEEVVKIKFAADESPLSVLKITDATLHVAMRADLAGQYRVEIKNLPEVIGTIQIRATAAARDSYQAMPYHVRLELDERDTEPNAPPKAVIYNFPQDALRANEIWLDQTPEEAKFEMIKITPESK
jgi:hypothetical protein